MENNFVTIGAFPYKQANYIRKQLQIMGIFSFTDSDGSNVLVQVYEEDLPAVISTLVDLSLELDNNVCSESFKATYIDSKLILVPVDLSNWAYELGRSAIRFAQRSNAEINFHHVYFESEGVSSSAAYENFQHLVHMQESGKAKTKMKDFAEAMKKFAESISYSTSLLHFGLSGGVVSEQIAEISSNMNPDLVFLGPENPEAEDHVSGITRKTAKAVNLPLLSLPLKWDYESFDPKKLIYIAESDEISDKRLAVIDKLMAEDSKCSVLVSKKSGFSKPVTTPSGRTFDLVSIDKIDTHIMDYLLKESYSGVVVEKPASGVIARLFAKDVSDAMMKQEDLPVLFLP
jgi:nucleotide-binding universal stress UspA family protein